MDNNTTTALTILLVCNSFIAGTVWEDNSHEPFKLRGFLALLNLIIGAPIHALSFLCNITRKPRKWIEARTNLCFFLSWPFRKNKYLSTETEYLKCIENHYAKNKNRFGIFNWLNAQAAKKILILNNRKLP